MDSDLAMQNSIDFWFSIGSTYSYLSIMRLRGIEAAHNVRFNWRPFNVREIMVEQNNRPFVGKPVKAAYMWRDIERRAAMYGLPIQVPAPYPLKEMELANRVAILAAKEGWCADYAVATYKRWFQNGLEPGSEPNLSDSLREIGQDPHRVDIEAKSDATGAALLAANDAARLLDIFGSPSFVVGSEIFWGDDRLDDALRWCQFGSLRPTA
jgi:2-hydroxychromene-2-carboxylate isomerase